MSVRLVAWNCRSGLHHKLDRLLALAPDIAIISECASIDVLTRKARAFAPESARWVGTRAQKGLGVFSFGDYHLVPDERCAIDPHITDALPLKVEGPSEFRLLALWAHYGLSGMRMATPGPTLSALASYRAGRDAADRRGRSQQSPALGQAGQSLEPRQHRLRVRDARPGERLSRVLRARARRRDASTFYWRTRSEDGPSYHIDYVFVPLTTRACFAQSWWGRARSGSPVD